MPRIGGDRGRFRRIVRGQIRKNLRKYMSSGELVGKSGGKKVSIPIHQIEIPKFKHGKNQGGVGSGEGEPGEEVGQGQEGEAAGAAGDKPGQHGLEAEVSLDDLARIMGEVLELPNIEPRGKQVLVTDRWKYNSIASTGPDSLRHYRRSFREALKRQIASGLYDPDNPLVLPIRKDMRYRSWKSKPVPESAAAVFYIMDVSGSMGQEQKDMVRQTAWWIDLWLQSQYKGVETVYVAHDAAAREVSRDVFYKLRESGGTKISSAYEVVKTVIEDKYPPLEWNIYIFQFSDGDNWGADDTKRCVEMLQDTLIPYSNLFCYGQVKSAYGSGRFINDLKDKIDDERLICSEIPDKEKIFDAIKEFLGKGK